MNNRRQQDSSPPDYFPEQPPGAAFFVTFRLAGTIPRTMLNTLNAAAKKQKQQVTDAYQIDLLQRQRFGRWDSYLDKAEYGPTWLRAPQVAQIIWTYLLLYVGQRYELDVFCIMPNHVHLLIRPLPQADDTPFPIAKIMQSLKAGTAVAINRVLGRQGQFWHHANYTHLVRDSAEAQRIITYIVGNPVKAGMVTNWGAWPWTYVADWLLSDTHQ